MIDIIDRFHTPPGGWYYRSGMYDLRGNTYIELIQIVSDHFRNNENYVGDVDRIVQNQIAERDPHLRINR